LKNRAITIDPDAEKEPTFTVEARNLDLRVGIDAGSYNKIADDMEIDAYLKAAVHKKL